MRNLAVPIFNDDLSTQETERFLVGKSNRPKVIHVADPPHRLEQAVQRCLLSHPNLHFASLVVRRIPNGVCLVGVLEHDGNLDVGKVARSIDGVNAVLNHLVVQRPVGAC